LVAQVDIHAAEDIFSDGARGGQVSVRQAKSLELQRECSLSSEVLSSVCAVEAVNAIRAQYSALLHARRNGGTAARSFGPSIAARVKNADLIYNLAGELEHAVEVRVCLSVRFAFLGEVKVHESDGVFFVANSCVYHAHCPIELFTQQTLALFLLVTLDKIKNEYWTPEALHQLAEVQSGRVVQRVTDAQTNIWFGVQPGRRLTPEQGDRRSQLHKRGVGMTA
jgi:hypothetical protein